MMPRVMILLNQWVRERLVIQKLNSLKTLRENINIYYLKLFKKLRPKYFLEKSKIKNTFQKALT